MSPGRTTWVCHPYGAGCAEAGVPADAHEVSLARLVELLLRLGGRAQERREQEEAEAGGEEQVADRRDVLEWREGERDDVREGAEAEEELCVERLERDVEDRAEVAGEAAQSVGVHPDRHPAAVDEDHEPVARDADEGEREARVRPVVPQREQQKAVGRAEERHPERVDDLDAAPKQDLRSEADDDREEQERQVLEADVRQAVEPAAEHEAQHQSERDTADQHRPILRCIEGRVAAIASPSAGSAEWRALRTRRPESPALADCC